MTPASPLALRVYRVLLFAGGAMLVGVGGLYQWGQGHVDPLAGRLAIGLAALALGALTFTSSTVRRHAIALVYGVFALASAWQVGAVATVGLTPATSFALLLVFMGCSAGVQTTRLLAAYSAAFLAATAAALAVSPPSDVPNGPFLATLGALGALGVYLSHARHQALAHLRAAREDALAAARAKSEFLAAMSHEIRTPLNGVIGMTDVLASTVLTRDQRESVRTIQASGKALLAVINDVLDFSKIEAGRLDLEPVPLDVRAFADDALAVVAPSVPRGVEVVCRVAPDVPAVVLADGPRLRQVVLNLLSNAAKFTEAGTVALDVGVGRRRGEVDLVVAVSDTGVGIPPDRLDAVFESFTQADASTTRRYGGTGLGLAISKRIVEAMGGAVRAESAVGEGSTFSITVPVPVVEGPPTPAASGAVLLVVDDHGPTREALAALAAGHGLGAQTFATGAEALDWVRDGGHYDVAAVDVTLEGESALAVADALRARPATGGRPLVLLSPVGSRAASPGLFDAVVTKPVRADRFGDVVARLTGGAAPALDPPAPAGPVDVSGLRVLVVEDNEVNRRVAAGLLGRLGVTPDLAEDGAQALDALERAEYDLVLMDVQMPVLDGLDATRRLRARPGPQPRVVALTANAMADDAARCRDAGMDGFLTKPVRLDDLRAELSALRAASPPSAATPPAEPLAAGAPAPRAGGPVPSPPAVAAHLQSLCDGDAVLAGEILGAYLGTEAALSAGLLGPDPGGAAHKLRAACGTLGADALAHALFGVESAARAGTLDPSMLARATNGLVALRASAQAAEALLDTVTAGAHRRA